MKRILLLIWIISLPTYLQAAEKPLNVIVILVDDLGWMDLSCQGSDYFKTLHIDQLAKEGMRFTNGYASCAVCSPTRYSVQTGRYPARSGITDWMRHSWQRPHGHKSLKKNPTEYVGTIKDKLLCPPNPYWMEHAERTLAEILKRNGYKTAYIGKWHLGGNGWLPTTQGFQVNKGGFEFGQPPSYFDPYQVKKSRHQPFRNGIPSLPGRKKGEYLTVRESDEAVTLINKWKNKPFFIQLSHYAVHRPIQAIPAKVEKYRQKDKTEQMAMYAAMVESVDDSTGKIMQALKANGLDDNTLVIFTSDNGGLAKKDIRLGPPTDNSPLRSGKGYPYEGGIRVPFIVRWNKNVKAATVSETPVCSIDIFPTILDAIQITQPKGHVIDGLSLVKHLTSSGKTAINRTELYWHFPHYRHPPGPYSIIRSGSWKLIKYYEGPVFELYNLAEDLSEKNNLAEKMPEKVKLLNAKLTTYLKSTQAKLPRPNPNYQPAK